MLDLEQPRATPTWLCVTSLGADNAWKYLPVELLHPAAAPLHLRRAGAVAAFEVVGAPENLVAAGIRTGICLTKFQITKLMEHEKIPKPAKGFRRKEHFAKAVIDHFHPDASDEDKARMLRAMMGRAFQTEVVCPEDVVLAVEHMDPENSKEFEQIRKVCLQQTQVNEEKKKEAKAAAAARAREAKAGEVPAAPEAEPDAAAAASSSADLARKAPTPAASVAERKNYTPAELKPLIPGQGQLAGVYLKRNPTQRNYTGYYPAFSSLTGC